MSNSQITWDVVTTVRERPEVLAHFVQHYMDLGCHRLHIYFDDPNDPGFDALADNPRLRLCPSVTPRAKRDGTSIAHGRRQSDNATDGLKHSRADWIIHLDADELLHADTSVSDLLGQLPDDVVQARVRPSEAIFTDFASAQVPFNTTTFRRAIDIRKEVTLASDVYGNNELYFRRGLSGHTIGKGFLRRNRIPAKGSIHAWKDVATGEWIPEQDVPPGLTLLHFDAISYQIWKEKLGKRIDGVVQMSGKSPNRMHQVDLFAPAYRAQDDQALQAFFCMLYVMTDRQIELMTKSGYIFKTAPAPSQT